jgi:hypothetical protein
MASDSTSPRIFWGHRFLHNMKVDFRSMGLAVAQTRKHKEELAVEATNVASLSPEDFGTEDLSVLAGY